MHPLRLVQHIRWKRIILSDRYHPIICLSEERVELYDRAAILFSLHTNCYGSSNRWSSMVIILDGYTLQSWMDHQDRKNRSVYKHNMRGFEIYWNKKKIMLTLFFLQKWIFLWWYYWLLNYDFGAKYLELDKSKLKEKYDLI